MAFWQNICSPLKNLHKHDRKPALVAIFSVGYFNRKSYKDHMNKTGLNLDQRFRSRRAKAVY